jgi:hypothetical protein
MLCYSLCQANHRSQTLPTSQGQTKIFNCKECKPPQHPNKFQGCKETLHMWEETPGSKLFDGFKVTSPHVAFRHWVVDGTLRGRGLVSLPGLSCGVPED